MSLVGERGRPRERPAAELCAGQDCFSPGATSNRKTAGAGGAMNRVHRVREIAEANPSGVGKPKSAA
jgi:hypothetical protein